MVPLASCSGKPSAEKPKESAYRDISVEEAHGVWEAGVFVLDVRTPREFEAGHLPRAVNINSTELSVRLGELEGRREAGMLVYCASGWRSASAGKLLAKNGFTGIQNMQGGFGAWTSKGLEVEK